MLNNMNTLSTRTPNILQPAAAATQKAPVHTSTCFSYTCTCFLPTEVHCFLGVASGCVAQHREPMPNALGSENF